MTSSLAPIDATWVQNAEGSELAVGFALAAATPPAPLYELDLYRPGLAPIAHSWPAATLGIDHVLALQTDPWDPARLMVLDPNPSNPQALEFVQPLTSTVTPYYSEPMGTIFGLHSLALLSQAGNQRVVWTARNTYNGFYYGDDTTGPDAGAPFIVGPVECSGCDMLHAVPDPSNFKSAFALCDTGGALNSRVVYRVTAAGIGTTAGTCVPVFRGDQLGARLQLTHLALAVP